MSCVFADFALCLTSRIFRLEFISTHPTLKVLKLNNNGMGPAGGADIAGALLANAEKAKIEGRVPSLQTLICGWFALLTSVLDVS